MSQHAAAHELMLKSLPHLRAFAISLTGDLTRADDLVQEALLRALSNLDRFEPGTNMRAWLFTILRNLFHTEFRKRKRKREIEDVDGAHIGPRACPAGARGPSRDERPPRCLSQAIARAP